MRTPHTPETAMPHFAHTLSVSAPPSAIFSIVDDFSKTPQWLSRCTGIDKVSEGANDVGTQLKYHYNDGRRSGTMDGQVIAHEPDRHFAMKFTDKMMDVTVDFDMEPGPNAGQTRLTHTITIDTKGFGKVFTPMINRQLPGQTEGAMTQLKRLAESAG